MPYPVPPPAPPPVVNFLSSENIDQPASIQAAPEVLATDALRESPSITPESPLGQPSEAAEGSVAQPSIACAPERLGSECDRSERVASQISQQSPPPARSVPATAVIRAESAGRQASLLVPPIDVRATDRRANFSPFTSSGLTNGLTEVQADLGVTQFSATLPLPQAGQAVARPTFAGSWRSVAPPVASRSSSISWEQAQFQVPDLGEPLLREPGSDEGSIIPVPPAESDGQSDGQVITIPGQGESPAPQPPSPDSTQPSIEQTPEGGTIVPMTPSGTGEIVELQADRQQYDTLRRVFLAEGNVQMRFRQAILTADRVEANLPNRVAVAEGNVRLTRGDQVLRGDRFVYNFVQEQGTVANARGEVFLPSAETDFATPLPTDVSAQTITNEPLSQRVEAEQPLQGVTSPGGIGITVGGGGRSQARTGGSGEVRRLRFEADTLTFTADGWEATNVRLTNDPFSPPELEARSPRVTFRRLSPLQSEIRAQNPRLVFDQGFSLPLFRNRVLIDQREREPALAQFGFDERDRDGFFVQRSFDVVATNWLSVTITPQILIQRAISNEDGFFDPSNFGLLTQTTARLSPTTTLEARTSFSSLDLSDVENSLRANVQGRQRIGRYTLALDYVYRDRLFNGSLGFQNVQSSLGLVLLSPAFALGDTGINFSYQAGVQYINANTDRAELLDAVRDNSRVSLTRYQVGAALNRSFLLWAGTPLPATREEGLRFSPNPIVPYVSLFTGLRGIYSGYSSGDSQATLTGTIGIQGQLGHFSRNVFDYTAFNITYSHTLIDGESPFLFDRTVDRQILSFGIVQQLYGPFRIGFQTSINLDTSREIDTDYILEYSRRTYAITLRYSPVRETGSLTLRISDFNWTGTPDPFSGSRSVNTGVTQPSSAGR